jgi:hypothetical protein
MHTFRSHLLVNQVSFDCTDKLVVIRHHHHLSFMELGHLLTRSGLTCPEVSSKVCHDSFCQLGSSVSLSSVVYYEAFCLHAVFSFSCILVICPKLEFGGIRVDTTHRFWCQTGCKHNPHFAERKCTRLCDFCGNLIVSIRRTEVQV